MKLFFKYLLTIVLLILVLLPVVILAFYYGGERHNPLNTAINNFSASHKNLSRQLKSATKVLDIFYLFHQLIPDRLPVYSLTIDPNDLVFLNQNLPLEGHLTDEYKKAVPADFNYLGKNYRAKVRYRGDNFEHWRYAKKSWRIEFEELFEDQDKIDLILPEDRYFFIEPWATYIGKKLGLVSPEFSLIRLVVNGRNQGAYLKTEKWGERFLINHQFEPDANLYGEDEIDLTAGNLYSSVDNFKKFTSNSDRLETDKDDLKQLLDLLNQPDDKAFFAKIEKIIDIDNFLKWHAQATLVFSHSQKFSHNLIIYANPETDKLEFIPWDVAMADEPPVNPDIYYNPLMGRMLTNPEYALRRNRIMWQYVNNPENLADDLAYYDRLYADSRGAFYRDSLKLFPNLDFDLRVKKLRQRIIQAHDRLLELLNDTRAKVAIKPVNNKEASVTIESSGFADLEFIGLEGQNITVYQSGRLINFDQPIYIYTSRKLPKIYQPFLLDPHQEKFYLIAGQKTDWSQVVLFLNNAVTGEKVVYEII